MNFNSLLQEMFITLKSLGEIHIYISVGYMGMRKYSVKDESSSGGEDFEDSDSEYEYKVDEVDKGV
ncbi:UNVERIFIED_CONTAM: hypothetical protein Slati_2681400 [Sesamum latifolium]|uniref:Uncharacterized protein n=1 Tax=Sesamum latifolium TaxID=2727402 RepID=A0AAW2VYJ5_9LAMI